MLQKPALAAVVATAILVASSAHAADRLTVAAYGGSWGEGLDQCVFQPFEETAGVEVVAEPSASSVTLSKLKQQKGTPVIDVAWMDGGISELARDAGVIATMSSNDIPNMEYVFDKAKYHTSEGNVYALGTGFFALGITYNTDKIENKPTSWWDLWDEEYSGRIVLPSPVNSAGIPFFAHINKLAGGTFENLEPGVKKLNKLNVALFFDSSGVASSSYQSGEALIGGHFATSAFNMAEKGLPIAYVAPKEGAVASDIRVHIVKGTEKRQLAEDLVNFAVKPAQATCLANTLYVGPASKGAHPDESAQGRMPWGAQGSVDDLAIANWDKINQYRDKLTQTWNRKVAQ